MNSPASLPDFALVRLPDVLAMTGLGRATIFDHMERGEFPRPVKLGTSAVWPIGEIAKINAARTAGKSTAEVKALVAELMEARKVAV